MRALHAQCHLALGEASLTSGDRDPARRETSRAEAMFREMGLQFWLENAESALKALALCRP
jgi:hypothetical protein